MPVRMRNGATSSRTRSISSSCCEQAFPVEAVRDREARGVVGDDEVLVAERHRRAGHHLDRRSAVAPGGVAVAVTPECGAELGALADLDGRLVFELGEVVVDAAVEGQGDDLGRGRADAGQVLQRAVLVALRDLVVTELPHEITGVDVGLDPSALLEGSVLEVHDAIQCVSGGHRRHRPNLSIGSASPAGTVRLLPCTAMERFGFVGLPNAGKSSLYNALAGGGALAAPYAFATTDPNVGMARVPDPRLDALAEMSKSKNVVPATVQFVDIGGLVAGASKGEGLGNKFLSHIREVDAIIFVLRAFEDDDVPGPSDPLEHLGVVELELTYADLETVENQIERRRKAAKGDKSLLDEVAALDQAKAILETGTPLYRSDLKDAERKLLRNYFLLTNRAVMALVNVAEDQLDDVEAVVAPVRAELDGKAEVIGMCVQLEAEAAMLDADERAEMLEGLGLGEGALPKFLHAAYKLLGLRTFLTTGEKESRAWTFRAGYKAPQCAGVIHGDFERGFIRAEVIHWDELLELGSWNKAKDVGKLRVEGKDYVVQDGDVMEIRFNV